MEELSKEYTLLFNGISDTIQTLELAVKRLRGLQQQAEAEYVEHHLSTEEPPGEH